MPQTGILQETCQLIRISFADSGNPYPDTDSDLQTLFFSLLFFPPSSLVGLHPKKWIYLRREF